ncbi:hypothetical protein [Nesterenkonia sphaerica]|uniref:Type IV toxin-antitoxin system AbiEi family antitoxin domain-containing protein n=1 Tax=Nesterenkonia sphaerica TaxID=1804988 RepID=A0A5R9A9T0_9MICC|nr:hypothetical protein [Nesterenkonia sphaerica]TLP75532.1 hypothetical protein FEF27_07705 [Nesterenkonia sphaerica]
MASSAGRTPIELVAGAYRDGEHTSTLLARGVRAGRLFRVRSGVYVAAADWMDSPPWRRYEAAVAATAMSRDPVFCRETALLLHGVPLLRTPESVWARTIRQGGTGRVAAPALSGPLSTEGFRRAYRQRHPGRTDIPATLLRNIPTRLVYPPLPTGMRRGALLESLRSGSSPLHETTTLRPHAGIRGPRHYRVEPLELALIDTASRMPFDEAVVALDWAQAQPHLDLQPWLHYLSTVRMRTRWQQAWAFADPASESPGESYSRVLIHQLGFGAPSLQMRVSTDRGVYRVDFCWEEERVIGEFDGRTKYMSREFRNGKDPAEVVFEEKQREDALRRASWTVVRWTWEDFKQPERLGRFLANAGVSRRR